MAQIVLAELDIDVSALVKSTAEVKATIDQLKASQKALTQSGETSSEQFIQNASDLKILQSAYTQNIKALADNTQATADATNRTELLSAALGAEATSIAEARAQNALLNKLRNEANATTAEGQAEILALNNALDANNEFIKENADNYLKQKINIGNYKDSIKDAFQEMNVFNGGLSGFIERSKEAGGVGNLMKSSLSGMATGFLGVAKASLAFIATPVGAFITALVVVFGAIKNAMDRSEAATASITKIFSIFGGIVNGVLKAVTPLGEYFIKYYVGIMEKVGQATEAAMHAISSGLKFLGFNDAAKSVDNFTESTKASIKQAQQLADAEKQLETETRKARLTQLEYQKDAEKLRQIRDDESKSTNERIQANKDLGLVLQRQLKEELRIAEVAVKVANLRIAQTGKTKDNLDAQADALTQIADIQERITGQESEQLVNINSLRKEAADKEKGRRAEATARAQQAVDNAIAKSKQELDLFIAQQGFKAKSLEEELSFENKLRDKKLKNLKQEYDNKKKTTLEFETESLNIKNDFLLKQAEITVKNADLEFQAFVKNNQSKLDANKFLSDEMVNDEISRLGSIAEADKAVDKLRYDQKLINRQEYEASIAEIDAQVKASQDAVLIAKDEADKEKQSIDLENKKATDLTNHEYDLEFQLKKFDDENAIARADALKKGADTKAFDEASAISRIAIEKKVQDNKLQLASNTFGSLAELLGKESKAGKAAAIAQVTIDTYKSATSAYSAMSGIPIVGPILGAIAAGVAVAAGLANVKKIASTSEPKFAGGGLISINGKSHAQGGVPIYAGDQYVGEAQGNEGIGIMNRGAFSKFMDFNNTFGDSDVSRSGFYAGGGIISQGVNANTMNSSDISNIVLQAVSNLPRPVVAVDDIINGTTSKINVVERANF